MTYAIGVDLGTTFTAVGVWKNGQVEIIANDQGNRTTPSYVAFTDSERLIGESAKYQAAANPKNTVFDAKRPRRRVLLYVCRAPLGVAAPGGQAAAGAVLVKRFAHPQ